ncbi:MAG TPA: hypothetical protein VFN18_04545 [Solirubrobacterales bacterium]|nr:hypothetical protein [Solirubrobacterales bacterium]
MKTTLTRSAESAAALLAALVAFVAFCSPALAGPAGSLDRSFARHGALFADFGSEPWWGGVQQLSVGADGRALVLTEWNAIARFLSDGSLDTTFADDGFLTGDAAQFRAMASAPDGRIVTVGQQRRAGSDPYAFEVDRYLPAGAPDRSFGRRGTVLLPGTGQFFGPEWVGVEPGGKIVLAGVFGADQAQGVEAMRLLPSGRLDRGYGHDGVARVRTRRGFDIYSSHDLRRDCCALAEGKLTIATATEKSALLVRLGQDGAPDPGFGTRGVLLTGFPEHRLSDIALQGDGRFLLASDEGKVARFLPDGTRDLAFGSAGVAAPLPQEVAHEYVLDAIAVQADGRVLLAGIGLTQPDGSQPFVLARLDANGSLDPGFGTGAGFSLTSLAPDTRQEGTAVVALPDGRILLGGALDPPGSGRPRSQLALLRYLPDGDLDPSFGSGGAAVTRPRGQANDAGSDLLVQPDGRAVVAGQAAGKVLVARVLPGGRPDRSFGGDGFVLTRFGDDYFGEAGEAVTRLPDGRILVGAGSETGGALLLYRPGGRLDPRFGDDGIVRLPSLHRVFDTVVTREGELLAAGLDRRSGKLHLLRFHPSGAPDRRFGGDGEMPLRSGSGGLARIALRPDGRAVVLCAEYLGRLEEVTRTGKRVGGFGKGDGKVPIRAKAIALDRHGRILVGGRVGKDLAVARFTRGGELDRSFGRRGYAVARVARFSEATGLQVQPDAKVVVAGVAYPCPELGCQNSRPLLARFTSGGAPDRSFGRGGVWTARVGKTGKLSALALAGRSILATGYATRPGFSRDLLLVRLRG